jgi:ankyrin repeat protein
LSLASGRPFIDHSGMKTNTTNQYRRPGAHRLLIIFALALAQASCGDSAQTVQEQGLALLEIAERGDVSALDALLKRRADADYRDSCHWTPLMKAALNGHLESVQRLLNAGAEADAADKGGYTSLMLAASNNHADVVALLLDHGAMIDAREDTQGFTPLIWAAQRGHRATVELLLARGADPTLPDFEGKTAAERASEQNHDALRALLDAPDSIAQAATHR